MLSTALATGKSILNGGSKHSNVVRSRASTSKLPTPASKQQAHADDDEDDVEDADDAPSPLKAKHTSKTPSAKAVTLSRERSFPKFKLNLTHPADVFEDEDEPSSPPKTTRKPPSTKKAMEKKKAVEPDWDLLQEFQEEPVEEIQAVAPEDVTLESLPDFDPGALVDEFRTSVDPFEEDQDPAVREPTPPHPADPKESSQESHKTNASKESIVPDSQPSRGSGASNGVRSQSNPPVEALPSNAAIGTAANGGSSNAIRGPG